MVNELAQVAGGVGDGARAGSSMPTSSGSCDKPGERHPAFRSEMRYGGEVSSGTVMAARASRRRARIKGFGIGLGKNFSNTRNGRNSVNLGRIS